MAWCKEMLCFNWVEDERIIKEITLLNQGSFWKGMEEAFMLYNYRKPTNKERWVGGGCLWVGKWLLSNTILAAVCGVVEEKKVKALIHLLLNWNC